MFGGDSNEYPQHMFGRRIQHVFGGDSNEYPQHMFGGDSNEYWHVFMENCSKLSFNYHQIPSLCVPLVGILGVTQYKYDNMMHNTCLFSCSVVMPSVKVVWSILKQCQVSVLKPLESGQVRNKGFRMIAYDYNYRWCTVQPISHIWGINTIYDAVEAETRKFRTSFQIV